MQYIKSGFDYLNEVHQKLSIRPRWPSISKVSKCCTDFKYRFVSVIQAQQHCAVIFFLRDGEENVMLNI